MTPVKRTKAMEPASVRQGKTPTDRPIDNKAVRETLAENVEDLAAFSDRQDEPTLSFKEFVKNLRRSGKI